MILINILTFSIGCDPSFVGLYDIYTSMVLPEVESNKSKKTSAVPSYSHRPHLHFTYFALQDFNVGIKFANGVCK